MVDSMDFTSRFNNFLNVTHKPGIADIQPKVITQQNLGAGTFTISQLAASSYSSTNTPSTLVFRDTNGNFACNTITGKTTGNELPLTFNAPFSRSVNTISYSGDLPLSAHNIVTDTTTGSKIGTATGQKIGFWNVTPVVQQVLATGAAHTVDDVITFLQTIGLCKQS